jgi:tetratricopeptide (TPR) repeat protein
LKIILKWTVVFCVAILIMGLLFSAYANFFLDYSLQRLEVAMDAAGRDFNAVSPLSRDIYSKMVKDLAVEEATREKADYQNIALLELASRSLDEAIENSQMEKARFYLDQVLRSKLQERPAALRFTDGVFHFFSERYLQAVSFLDYLKARFPGTASGPGRVEEYSSILILNRAQEKLREAKTDEAVELYRKYLDLYPTQSERGFVTIALADVYIKQGRLEDAKKLLREVGREFAGREESVVAESILRRIGGIEKSTVMIDQIRNQLPEAREPAEEQVLKLKMAKAYLSARETDAARGILDELALSDRPEIRREARFYQAWSDKLESRFEQSAATFMDLLADPEVEEEMRLLLQTQLADVYYQQGEVRKSLAEYQAVSEKASQDTGLPADAFGEIWVALSELEKAKIYKYNLGDMGGLGDQTRLLNELDVKFGTAGKLQEIVQGASSAGLRERAFYELENGRVHIALDLFEKDLLRHSSDAWTHSGLAIVYILLGDAERSMELARQGYDFGSDYYTASVLGYVHALLGRYEDAETYYQEAVGRNPDYLPVRFNLASLYLKMGKYREGIGLLARLERDLGPTQRLLRAKILNNIGYAYWQMGDMELSQAKFKESLSIMPTLSMAKNNLSLVTAGEVPQLVTFRE